MTPEGTIQKWFALYVKPRHEKVVARLLQGAGLESFLPLYKRQHTYSTRTKDTEIPLFPGYVFCRFDVLSRTPILATTGVLSIVGIGKTPTPIDEVEILSLQTAMKAGLLMKSCDFLAAGRRVRISKGALMQMEGVVVEVRSSLRLILSITLLQRSVQVVIDSSWVTPCEPFPRLSSPLTELAAKIDVGGEL